MPGLELEHECPSNLLLPAYGDRKLDLAALVTLPEIESALQVDEEDGKFQIPVMLIETGKKNTSWPIVHKDSSKMEAALSAVCTRFAFDLQKHCHFIIPKTFDSLWLLRFYVYLRFCDQSDEISIVELDENTSLMSN